MASLEDFSPQSKATLDDFQIEAPLVPINNKPSNVNLAAYTASLSENPESVEAAYLRNSEALDKDSDGQTIRDIRERAKDYTLSAERQSLAQVLADPDLSDDEKESAANAYLDEQSSLYNIRNIVSSEALISDVDDETEESSNARIDFARSIENVNEYHRQKQIRLNRELSAQDPSMLEMGAGFLELIAPFTEQAITGKMLSDIRGGDRSAYFEAFGLLGSSKAELRDSLKRVPPAQRGPLIEKLVDAVNNNSSIVFPDENDFARVDFLRSVLEEGGYSEGEEWLDNAIGIMDLVGLPVGVASRWFQRGTRAGRAADTAEAGLETPRTTAQREASFAETASDAELRAAEDQAEVTISDRRLRAEEDASEARIRARQREMQADPVRRAEDAAERRAEARRAVRSDSSTLRSLEDAAERRATAVKTGGNAARLTDDELRAAENVAEEMALESRREYVRTETKPVSLSQAYKNTNPTKARVAHTVAGEDTSGGAARALYGTSRTEAMADDSVPQVARVDGSVPNKVSMPDDYPSRKPSPPSARVMDVASDNGAIYLTDAEKLSTATRIVNDFNNVSGLVARTEMSVPEVSEISNKMRVGVTYGPRDNGWASGTDAVEKVKTSLRHYGVKDSDITLLERRGDDYVPTKVENATEDGDYLVKVDYPANIDAGSVEEWNDLDVLYNFLDRVPHNSIQTASGSFQRHILDAHSMLHPNITLGANMSVDKSAQLENTLIELTKTFTDKYNSLSRTSQQALESEIKRANREGQNRSTVSLKADGFGDEEVEALKSWREVWDTMYWVENQDLVKTMRNRNYKVMEDPSTDTRLFVKELSRNRAGSTQRAYDTETGRMVTLTSEDLTDLYEKGGSVGTLRSKMLVNNEEAAESVIVRNQPGSSYARQLRDDDQILNYREGYYTVYYDAPKFIDRVVRDSRGNEIKRGAVATAKDTSTAARFQKRFQQEAEEGVEYVVRDNRERMRFDGDDSWNLQEAAGRTAQRVRGERLEDATSPITDEAHNHVIGPVDSLIRSARNVSSRVPMRDYLEATKTRAINQYGHMFPKDQYGRPNFPTDSSEIKANEGFGKEAADARTTVEYIRSLENGYINQIDDGIKYGLRAIADAAGKKGLSLTERALNASAEAGGPTRLARGTAFTLYLALNPLRQFVVQSHQMVQLAAINPRYMTTKLLPDMALMLEYKVRGKVSSAALQAAGRSESELKEMSRAYDSSGLSASIDKSNLVRGSLTEIADSTAAGAYRRSPLRRAQGLFAQGIAAPRRAGFDAGEEMNMMSSWLAHYDMARRNKDGAGLSTSELDRVASMARSYTYNMNRAGDMPYNENALGMIFQFMQVPHKAFLQMTANRNLTRGQKARLATFNLAMYGIPSGSILSTYVNDWLPESGESRETVLQGVEGYVFNKLASLMYGEDSNIDFSGLAASDLTGLMEFVTGLWTTDAGTIVAESPAGSLVMGSNPRITNFARTASEYFRFTEPTDGSVATAGELAMEFARLSSGASNLSKAFQSRVVDSYARKYNSSGGVTDSNVTKPEQVASAFGFQTLDEARGYWASNEIYQQRKQHDDDAKEWYRLVKRQLAREGINNDEREFQLRVLNVAAEQFRDDPRAHQEILNQLRYDVQNGDLSLYNSVLDATPWMKPENAREVINSAPGMDEGQREQARRTLEFIDNYREE